MFIYTHTHTPKEALALRSLALASSSMKGSERRKWLTCHHPGLFGVSGLSGLGV